MLLNKTAQYGILLSLYLSRSGRARLVDVAANLNLKFEFLSNIATALTKKHILISYKGPGGGYELNGTPTVLAILKALKCPTMVMPTQNNEALSIGTTEKKSLAMFALDLNRRLYELLNSPVQSLNTKLMDEYSSQMKHSHTLRAS